jgi:hypothetical protein
LEFAVRLSRVLIPLAAASLVLTACGGSNDAKSDTTSKPQQVSAGTMLNATWPLTGLPVTDHQSAAQKYPVYIAKIDNTAASDPQYGLSKADMVTEELVEGGITRLAVFFYSRMPDKVGPIRSMRATDVGIASPVKAQLVTSGAAPYTYTALKRAGVKWIDMNNPNVKRVTDGSHDYLHSVVADLAKVSAAAKGAAARPEDYFPWGGESSFPGRKRAGSIAAKFSAARTDEWQFKGGKYVLQNNYMASGDEFTPATVVAAMVKTSIAPYLDPAGNPVPVSHFNGKGKAWIFHGGKVVKATWVKKTEHSPVKFTLPKGTSLTLPAGKVWLELVPENGGSVTFTKK